MVGWVIIALLVALYRRRGHSRLKATLLGVGTYMAVPVVLTFGFVSILEVGEQLNHFTLGIERLRQTTDDAPPAIAENAGALAPRSPGVQTEPLPTAAQPARAIPIQAQTPTAEAEDTGAGNSQEGGYSLYDIDPHESPVAANSGKFNIATYDPGATQTAEATTDYKPGYVLTYVPNDPETGNLGESVDSACDPAYPDERTCIPPGPPFDQGCAITSERLFTVLPPDPQGLDADGDGIGCEPIVPASVGNPAPRQGGCDPAYPDVCIPSPPPNLDCSDAWYFWDAEDFAVYPPDPHGFDGWNYVDDGIGCEGY